MTFDPLNPGEEQRVRRLLTKWREHPSSFVRECLGAQPDIWQEEALEAFAVNERLALKACKGPGKTTVLAWLILNFLATRMHPRIGCTSITGANLDNNLWPEIATWLDKSPVLRNQFVWSKTRVESRLYPATWFAAARTWPANGSTEQQADALAGLHAPHVMFVLDESGGMPQALMVTAEAVLATGVETKVVQAGNPTHTTGPLHRACTTDRHLWYVVTITGDPDDPKRSPRIKLDWARQQIQSYGRDNPWVMVNVLGQFPPASINSLLGIEDVEASMKRTVSRDVFENFQKRLGIDVARYGDDLTVIFPRQGKMAFKPKPMRHARGSNVSTDIAAAVIHAKLQWGSEVEIFDSTGGWAAGAVDVMRTGAYGSGVIDRYFHAKATDPRYKNVRAELHFAAAEWVLAGGCLPYVPEMIPELTEPTYTFVNGQFLLEDKDAIKERLGRSPNYADAFALTFGLPESLASAILLSPNLPPPGKVATEFDPYRTTD